MFGLCVLILLVVAAGEPPGKSPEAAAPGFDLVLERDGLLPVDEVPVEVWLANPADRELTDVTLELGAPDFLGLGAGDCPAQARTTSRRSMLQFGRLLAGSVLSCRARLQTTRDIVEGEHTVAFGLRYRTAGAGGAVREGYLLKPQKLKVSLFGSQTVGGVDLSVLSYLVPGLVFLLVLRLLKTPVIDLSTTDASLAAVGFSIFMLYVTSKVAGSGRSTSPLQFLFLCLGALVVATVVGSPWLVRLARARRRKQLLIEPESKDAEVFEKALRQQYDLYPWPWQRRQPDLGPVRFRTPQQQHLWGSLVGETKHGTRLLLGWMEVDPGADPRLREQLRKKLAAKDLRGVLRVARCRGLRLQAYKRVCEETVGAKKPEPRDEWKVTLEKEAEKTGGTSADLPQLPIALTPEPAGSPQ